MTKGGVQAVEGFERGSLPLSLGFSIRLCGCGGFDLGGNGDGRACLYTFGTT